MCADVYACVSQGVYILKENKQEIKGKEQNLNTENKVDEIKITKIKKVHLKEKTIKDQIFPT